MPASASKKGAVSGSGDARTQTKGEEPDEEEAREGEVVEWRESSATRMAMTRRMAGEVGLCTLESS